MTTAKDGIAIERLKVLKDNTDGFKISEYDYKMRGGGDFMGSRQSGKFMKDLGNLVYGIDSIFMAKKIADEVFTSGNIPIDLKQVAMEKYSKLKDVALN